MISHPQIISAKNKEVHFFDNFFNKGLDWYIEQFPIFSSTSDEKLITGEASPYYIFHPLAAKRIFKIFPKVKLIVLLRDPVERAYSHYNHEVRIGCESQTFENAIKKENERLYGQTEKILSGEYSFNHQNFSYLTRGIYVDQLREYFDLFPKENFVILSSEEFYQSPQSTLNQVFDFLELGNFKLNEFSKFNFGDNPPMRQETRKYLAEYFKPHNERLYKFLKKSFNW